MTLQFNSDKENLLGIYKICKNKAKIQTKINDVSKIAMEFMESDLKKEKSIDMHTENILQLHRSDGQYEDNLAGEKSQEALAQLEALESRINAGGKMPSDEFLGSLESIMRIDEQKSGCIRHYVNDCEYNLRISNHGAKAIHAKFRPNETSLVIKLSSVKFQKNNESYLVEFVYDSKNMTAEKQNGIIKGLEDWIRTGDFTNRNYDRNYFSPSKELSASQHKQYVVPNNRSSIWLYAWWENIP